MFAFVKSRAFVLFVGFALLAAFLWYAGPYFAFGESRPLESSRGRLIAFLLVVGVWGASMLIKRLRANRASDKLLAAVVQQSKAEERPSADVLQLRERFEEGVAALKHKRRSGHSLYELPWYVIIGAPGSGKTTALINSGLHFPLEQRSGKGALRGVGGTRNCDWWFTDEAVFLDTAGRYTTQDSDAAGDSAGWTEFLALLRKYRKRRPVNGVILTISAQDLLVQGQSGREAHVTAARRRLNELNRELRIQLPVYLMVTKCDLVAGFTEYFDDLPHEGRAQVWGTTFSHEQTVKGETARAFPAEFDALIARLNARVFARLEEDRDVGRRTKIFAFPQQMSALRDLLADFVSDVFASTRFDQQVLLRGIYFTSGTQEGTPIDRLLGAIGRRFAVAPDAVVPSAGRGKAYFIERLLKEVLLAESGLAGVNRRVEVQKAAAQLAVYAAIGLFAVLGTIALSVSYSRNGAYLAAVHGDIAALQEMPRAPRAASLASVLPRLDAIRAVVDSANRYPDGAPWAMRWGLYQATSIGNAARDAYVRELDGALLPHVAARIKERLTDYVPEPEKLYEYLKAYLMLGHPEYLDKAQLGFIADLEWQSLNAEDPDAGAALSRHFSSLLEHEDGLRPVTLDDVLVQQARSTIRQASIPELIYRQLRLTYASDSARALRLDQAAGVGAERVLKRKSGVPLSQPVLSVYTHAVFREITGRGTAEVVRQFAADHWVWGEAGVPRVSSSKLAADVIDVYEKDYIAAWDRILKDIEPVSMGSLATTKEALAILAASTSPLRAVLKTIDENTFLAKPPEAAGQEKGVKERLGIQQKLEPVGSGVGQTDPLDPATVNSIGELVNALKRDATALPASIRAVVTEVADRTAAATRRGVSGTLETRYRQNVVRECHEITGGRYPFADGSNTDVPLADFGRLFGYGGVFDTFFKEELEPLVDRSRSPWVWRADASGASVGPSMGMLRQFESAKRIRETFFRAGSQDPELRFRLTPAQLDAGATRFLLEVDGQHVEYRHGPERSVAVTWPGQSPGPAAVTFEDRSGTRPNIVANGPWAWFRLIDDVEIERESDVRYVLTFAKGGHEARVRLEAVSIRNPFGTRELQQFQCGAGS